MILFDTLNLVRFPYQCSSGRYRPIIDVMLFGPDGSFPVKALVDSGADFSIFDKKVAEDLGFQLKNFRDEWIQFGGNKHVPGKTAAIFMQIGEKRLKGDAVFIEQVGFSYYLLGRAKVFNQFSQVAFEDPHWVTFSLNR